MNDPGADGADIVLQQARAWARRLAVGRPTAADAEALRRWCAQSATHAQMWRRASAEWREMGEVLQTVRQRIPAAQVARPVSPSRRWFVGAAVATAAGVVGMVNPPLGLWPSWSEMGADYRTAVGEQLSVALNAHIQLLLNTQTSLSVRRADPLRVELIAGEAEIRNDGQAPLEIQAGSGRIQLAAGCVEIRHLDNEETRVLCTEGQAELYHADGILTLEASESASYGTGHTSAAVRNTGAAPSDWRQGYIVFNDTPLVDAVAEINRYRSGRVILMNDRLARQRISGRFAINDTDQAIDLIRQLYAVHVRRVANVVMLG
ncbi:FecR domain-containing protein [Pigmentiphaga sp. NML080357]|uniref:FecR family protein n=1 Tax=Pigmentiphaga sp. NML080357 TaxID=2008675 RepID=UPI001E315E68|nr:FecR domain-containing protein [Pigmentiphaga sp. NML080357]